MRRVLLDTNIVLDFLLQRQPFVTEAEVLWQIIKNGEIQGYVSATTLTNIFYITRKSKGVEMAKQDISEILSVMEVCTVDRNILEIALSANLTDFEDAVQVACAMDENLYGIITRDRQDFAGANLPIFSPSEFLQLLAEENKNKGDN